MESEIEKFEISKDAKFGIEKFEISRGGKFGNRLSSNGYHYYKYYEGPDGKIHWRCGQYRNKCKSKVVTSPQGNKLVEVKNDHNHPVDVPIVEPPRPKPVRERRKTVCSRPAAVVAMPARTKRMIHVENLYPIQAAYTTFPFVPLPVLEDIVKEEPCSPSESLMDEDHILQCSPDIRIRSPSPELQSSATVDEDNKSSTREPEPDNSRANNSADEFEVTSRKIAYQLRAMTPKQQIIAEKLLADVMFHGQLGHLLEISTLVINP